MAKLAYSLVSILLSISFNTEELGYQWLLFDSILQLCIKFLFVNLKMAFNVIAVNKIL